MDIAAMLRFAVQELPEGEFSAGITAIVRHVEAAIRHYERAAIGDDEDAYTDCIYRTNQAYEGSLKEAYRIMAQCGPEKKSLFEIENYFYEGGDIRSRVIDQMSRYRTDYRNPSTHDYRLDFDENEALLAIVSVSAFAKLLVSQIKSKLDTAKLASDPAFDPKQKIKQKSASLEDFAAELSSSFEASRVFRRLLFVRRSCDERYKEQVFA